MKLSHWRFRSPISFSALEWRTSSFSSLRFGPFITFLSLKNFNSLQIIASRPLRHSCPVICGRDLRWITGMAVCWFRARILVSLLAYFCKSFSQFCRFKKALEIFEVWFRVRRKIIVKDLNIFGFRTVYISKISPFRIFRWRLNIIWAGFI